MKIEEMKENHFEEVKNLLVELQEFIIEIDNFNLNTISNDYREKYFEFMLKDCKDNKGKVFVAIENEKTIGIMK